VIYAEKKGRYKKNKKRHRTEGEQLNITEDGKLAILMTGMQRTMEKKKGAKLWTPDGRNAIELREYKDVAD